MSLPSNTTQSPTSPPSPSPSTTAKHLPPSRSEKGKQSLKSVAPPLHSVSFSRFIYGLVLITALVATFYSYRLLGYKKDVGGWWNLITGVKPPLKGTAASERTPTADSGWGEWKGAKANPECNSPVESVEHHIIALAGALGMQTDDLTRAIALAIRQYVPPASLASVAAKQSETGKAKGKESEIMKILVSEELTSDDVKDGSGRPMNIPTPEANDRTGSRGAGILESVVGGVESMVGIEEP